MNPFALFIILALLACSADKHSGVMTDTHTGGKLSGVVRDSLDRPVSARVRLVNISFSAAGEAPVMEIYTDSSGAFEFDSIPPGLWNLVATDTTADLTLLQEVQWQEANPDLDLGNLVASPAASLTLLLAESDLRLHDTIFVLGTDAAVVIDANMLAAGAALLKGIPANVLLELGRKRMSTITILLTIDALGIGQRELLGGDTILPATMFLRLELGDSLSSPGGSVNAIPMPIWLPDSLIQPCLLNNSGNLTLLDSTWASGDSVLYWGTVPYLDLSHSSSIEFAVYENCPAGTPVLGRLNQHLDTESDSAGVWGNCLWMDSNSHPYALNPFTTWVDSASVGVSLWLRILHTDQPSTYVRILESSYNNSGFILQQKANRNTIELRINTKDGAYNEVFGASDLLDGQWHHYAFSIQNNRVLVVADGALITDTTFALGSGFTNSTNPLLGNDPMFHGCVDELMFFEGSQGALWWKVLYELQKPKTAWIWEL